MSAIVGGAAIFCYQAPRYRYTASPDSNKHRNHSTTASDREFSFNKSKNRYFQTGSATYYADKFHGRKTASGERYNRNKLTAAHRTLPFGTVVRVKSLVNGKTVTVRINDRLPYKKGNRVIDLSRAAAREIDMISAGVVPVEIEIVKE